MDSERQRLYSMCKESRIRPLGEEERLLHFGVYLLVNQVDFEPFIYWSLLQHFASFSLLVEERFDNLILILAVDITLQQFHVYIRTSRVCIAARRTLAFVECSTTQEQKKLFIQWNTAYYQFRLIIRHVMNGITHVFSRKYDLKKHVDNFFSITTLILFQFLRRCPISCQSFVPALLSYE